jgi:hypothetical protein
MKRPREKRQSWRRLERYRGVIKRHGSEEMYILHIVDARIISFKLKLYYGYPPVETTMHPLIALGRNALPHGCFSSTRFYNYIIL